MQRLGSGVLFFEPAKRVVDALEVRADGLGGDGIVGLVLAAALAKYMVAEAEDDFGIGDFVAFGARRAGFGAVAEHCAALIVVILHERARGVVGDEVELVPEAIEFFLALLIEDQFLSGVSSRK